MIPSQMRAGVVHTAQGCGGRLIFETKPWTGWRGYRCQKCERTWREDWIWTQSQAELDARFAFPPLEPGVVRLVEKVDGKRAYTATEESKT